MEFVALGGLILLGLSQNKDTKQLKPIVSKTKEIVEKDISQVKSIQDLEHIKLEENNYPVVDNVLESLPNTSKINEMDDVNELNDDESNMLSEESIDMKDNPVIENKVANTSYESMFAPLSIRNGGIVKSLNEAPMTGSIEDPRLKREIDYMEGFSDFNGTEMNYGITDDFSHNNMIPSTSKRDQTLMNYDNYNTRLNLHTGSSVDWVPKKEVERMFAPAKHGRGLLNGKPYLNGQLGSRYIPSFKNNMGNLPFKNKVKVKPGIEGEVQEGRHGSYRVLPRNIDELRSETNQKCTYKQPIIESGKQGRLPTNIGKYNSLKNSFINRDVQEGKSNFSKSVPRPKLTHVVSNNRANEISYKGPSTRNMGNKVRTELTESGKQNYYGDGLGRNLNDMNRGMNVEKSSINLPVTNRESTSHNIAGNVNPNDHYSYSNLQDEIKQTIKQTTLYARDGNVNPNDHYSYSNLQDEVKPTVKQTTLYARDGNVNPNDHYSYSNLQDEVKPTVKQTTLFSHNGNINPNDNKTYTMLTDEAKPTIKHTTLYSHDGNLNPNERQVYSNLQDKARNTIKQTTMYTQEGNLRGNDETYVRDKEFKAKQTVKETTLFATPEQNLSRPGASVDKQIIMDVARPTIKQTTLLEGHINPLNNAEKKARVFDDALNMQINDCKEEVLKTRPHQGGDQKFRVYYEKEADTRQKVFTNSAREPRITRSLDYQTPDKNLSYNSRIRDTSVVNNYHITDNFINTLKDNPLVNDLMHQKNINYTL